MILRTLLLVFCLSAAAPVCGQSASAQPVNVRSGEHPGFSRLVFETDTPVGWTLGRGPGGYLLRFETAALSFDLSRVFTMIPRSRLSDIRVEAPGLLALDIAGVNHAEAFVLRPGVLVLDIKTGPAPAGSPYEAPLEAGPPAAEAQEAPAESSPDPEAVADESAPAPLPEPPVRLPIGVGRLAPDPVIGPFLPAESPPARLDPRVASARSELMQQIGRAAAQGLLEPATDISEPETDAGSSAGSESASAARESDANGDALAGAGLAEGLGDRANIRIETSIDQGLDLPSQGQGMTVQGERCLPDSDFDLAAWIDDRNPADLIADRRSKLLTMRDSVDPDGARALARTYIALGFGAEASQVLDLLRPSDGPVEVWRAMGEILDQGQADRPEVFEGQLSCPSRAALWAALARPELPEAVEIDEAAVLRSFSELPLHIRVHLGPLLAERFLARGDQATARRIRNAVARAGEGSRTEDLALVEAQLELAQGETGAAQERIDEVLSEGGAASPEALALQLETDLAEGRPPEADSLGLAEALAFERRGTALGTRLLSLSIRGHAARGEFRTAFIMLAHHGLEGQRAMASDLILALAQEGTDADFVRESFSGILTNPGLNLTGEARLAVAGRLATLGFPARAEDMLRDLPPRGTEQERLVRAQISLAQGQPGQALQYIAGLDGEAAERMRAQAAQRQGDLEAAARSFGALGETGRQAALAWRARDWDLVEAAGTPAQSDYAGARRSEPDPVPDDAAAEPSLAGARAALAQSEAMRARLNGLLGKATASP